VNPTVPAQVVAADSAALDLAAAIAEEALACHREALVLLAEGWRSETGSAITDYMDGQCAHATDIVDALRQAGGRSAYLPDTWADTGGGPSLDPLAGPSDPLPLPPDLAAGSADPIASPSAAPGPVPGPVPSSWAAPTAAQAPWTASFPASSPAGLPTSPAFADLGGTLVGLVAEIAQALGSYVDPATGLHADEDVTPEDSVSQAEDSSPLGRDTAGHPPTTAAVDPDGPAPPRPQSPAQPLPTPPLPSPPQELLAAERPPDPPATPVPAPVAPVAAPLEALVPGTGPPPDGQHPETPPPAAAGLGNTPLATDPGPASAAADASKTPCEIAADELPKAGE
jgi:hypothetical protein